MLSGPETTDGAANRVAEAIGEALAAPAGSVWVRLRVLSEEDFAETGGAPGRTVFVRVLMAQTLIDPEGTTHAVAEAVAEATGRASDEVHVVIAPPGS